MSTDARKIQEWRDDHPGARLTARGLLEIIGSAYLRDADLSGANLRDADLSGAYLSDANFASAQGVLSIPTGLPSGVLTLWRGPNGWGLKVGCWEGTPESLWSLIARDEGWPEARGAEVVRRRPPLEAALVLCDAYIADTEKKKEEE